MWMGAGLICLSTLSDAQNPALGKDLNFQAFCIAVNSVVLLQKRAMQIINNTSYCHYTDPLYHMIKCNYLFHWNKGDCTEGISTLWGIMAEM